MKRRQSKGGATQREDLHRRKSVRLRSTADLLAELEHALLVLERAKGDVAARVRAAVAILAEARGIIERDLERREHDVSRLLESHPHLRKAMERAE